MTDKTFPAAAKKNKTQASFLQTAFTWNQLTTTTDAGGFDLWSGVGRKLPIYCLTEYLSAEQEAQNKLQRRGKRHRQRD